MQVLFPEQSLYNVWFLYNNNKIYIILDPWHEGIFLSKYDFTRLSCQVLLHRPQFSWVLWTGLAAEDVQ